jgi:hypothetical protein
VEKFNKFLGVSLLNNATLKPELQASKAELVAAQITK